MSVPNATRPESEIELEDENPDGLPVEEEFWGKYNAHYEFPIGTALSVLAHVLIVAVLVFGFLSLMNMGKDKKPVPMMNLGGDDDSGVGSPGAGDPDPVAIGAATPADLARPDLPQDLNEVKEDIAKSLRLDDPTENFEIPDAMAAAIGSLEKDLQKKMLGAKKGDNTGGTGPGGTGADSTRARGLRWVMRFNTRSGRDYLDQLKALGAVVMIPVPPKNDKMLIFRDLGNPQPNQYATDSDIAEQSAKVQFQDVRKASNEAIQEALRLSFTPAAFWAFFPKGLEEELSRKEVAYQNKRAEDIKETIFQVIITGGAPRLQVVAQKLK